MSKKPGVPAGEAVKERRKMTEKEIKEYRQFMSDPDNSHRCEKCPANREEDDLPGLPCGQQKCWVDCHKGR